MNGERVAVRLYGVLVRLYPRRFRDEYGADMVQLIRDQCADEPTWRVCARAATDLAITIPAQHMETHRRNHLDRRLVEVRARRSMHRRRRDRRLQTRSERLVPGGVGDPRRVRADLDRRSARSRPSDEPHLSNPSDVRQHPWITEG